MSRSKVEEEWVSKWADEKVFESDPNLSKEKKFVTFPYPYMNGPLHIGHGFTATRVDVYARFKRMQGFNVLFPWAWHWTGQPIVAAAERLSKGDAAMIREFVEIDKVPKDELSKFYDPEYMAQYYTNSGRNALKKLGLSIDWRREFHTTDLEPTFNRFVLWQYNKLREKGYVTRGTHPVVWCPRDQSPTGDHDRVAGEGVTWEEFTLILFPFTREDPDLAGASLPAATFRPETIFGVTNLWLNPAAVYVEIEVDGESKWIVSQESARKLGDQLRKIRILREIKGKTLVGKKVMNPLKPGEGLIILPAKFVDSNNGTGVVYSVPAHAPMDFVALRDLKNDSATLSQLGLVREVENIAPIPLITISGMGEYPAVEIVEKMGIIDQNDPRVEEATKEIYKKEFHQGVLNKNTGSYQTKRVSEAKPLIIEKLRQLGVADSMYDLPEKVVCRCMTECTVKILEDQWFLKYSDPEWKKLAHECVEHASIFPQAARQWFHDVIDWIKDWPCARKVGLGTPLPWSPGWIVETLSDSTVYMAFYTIRVTIKKLDIGPESLTDSLFDYVFLGKGNSAEISKESHISQTVIEAMREEFLYWYPVNLRNSAKELIPNHLLFFVFQHTAFFPKELWPTAISANGMMMIEGVKMSKSKGNVITLWSALEQYGADSLRAALMSGAEGLEDLDWREKNVKDIESKIDALPSFIGNLESSATEVEKTNASLLDLWLESRIQKHISDVTSSLDAMRTKSAFQSAFFTYWNDLRHYSSRTETRPKWLINYAIEVWTKLLAPFVPFTCELVNRQRGSPQMISISRFPEEDEKKVHPDAELSESTVQRLVEDVQKVLKLLEQRPKALHVYISPPWQFELLSEVIDGREKKEKTSETLQRFFKVHTELDKKEIANALSRLVQLVNSLGEQFVSDFKSSKSMDESQIYLEAKEFLSKELELDIIVHPPSETGKYDPKSKAGVALPYKPAIYLE